MASLVCPLQSTYKPNIVSCVMQPSQRNIKVVINGATKDIGKAAIRAVSRARGMELAGAVDNACTGEDAGIVSGMEEALEVPIINDITMILGSIAQTKATGVVVDFTEHSAVYDNVKQAAAFGLSSVVYVPKIQMETVSALSAFCEKASMGCLVAPTLSVGSVLLQQAAISASFHYNNVEIVESRPDPSELPSREAEQIANNLTDLGQTYNKGDISTDNQARGLILGEDGIRVHSLVLPGITSSTTIHFSAPGEIYSLKHDITSVESLMPGLLIAIRKVVRLKRRMVGAWWRLWVLGELYLHKDGGGMVEIMGTPWTPRRRRKIKNKDKMVIIQEIYWYRMT